MLEEFKALLRASRLAARASADLVAYLALCATSPPCDEDILSRLYDVIEDCAALVSDCWQALQDCRRPPQLAGGGGEPQPYYEEVCDYEVWYYEDSGEVISWNTTSCWMEDTSGNMS
jgi:hypothetical protein